MNKTPEQPLITSNDFGTDNEKLNNDLSVVIEEPLTPEIRENEKFIKMADDILKVMESNVNIVRPG